MLPTETKVDEKKANERRAALSATIEQLQRGEQICQEALDFIETIEVAKKECKKRGEIPDFHVNLSMQFHNLAVLNPSASTAFIPALKKAFSEELSRVKNAIINAKTMLD